MKRILTWIAVWILVIGGAIAAFWPIDHWRLYDANLQPLALTHAEAYCVGLVGGEKRFMPEDPLVDKCVEDSSLNNETPHISLVIGWFCDGVQASMNISRLSCLEEVEAWQLWPLLHGGFTREWNNAYPRPRAIDEGVLDPRGGGRPATPERDSEGRSGSPLENTTEEEE